MMGTSMIDRLSDYLRERRIRKIRRDTLRRLLRQCYAADEIKARSPAQVARMARDQ